MSDVLVLDVGYRPVAITSWKEAIVHELIDRVVEVIDRYPDRYIRTPSWTVNMPSVVRLVRPVAKRKAVKFSRHNIYARDKGRCQYCGRRVSRDNWEYEHVVPRCQQGKTTWENIVVACTDCNQKKNGRTPEQAGMRLLSVPRKPKSLPDDFRFKLEWKPGMPIIWRDLLRNAQYWNGELEQDEQ